MKYRPLSLDLGSDLWDSIGVKGIRQMQLLPIHGSHRTTFRKETKFNFKDGTVASEFKTIEARIDSERRFKMSGGGLKVWQDHNPTIESIDVILRPVLVDATNPIQVAKFKKANIFFN